MHEMYELNLRFDVASPIRPDELRTMDQIEMTVEEAVALILQKHYSYVKVKQVSVVVPPADYPLDVDITLEQ